MTPREKAEAEDKAGRCIVCGKAEEGRKRGLCEQHYQELRRKSKAVRRADREEYEQFMIDRGLLLPSRQGQRLVESTIGDATEEFLAAKTQVAAIVEDVVKNPPEKKSNKRYKSS